MVHINLYIMDYRFDLSKNFLINKLLFHVIKLFYVSD
jgi:hypothetical protein